MVYLLRMDKKAVEFKGEIYKVQSVANGGYRVTINIPSIYGEMAAWLMRKADKTGTYFDVLVAEEDNPDQSPKWQD